MREGVDLKASGPLRDYSLIALRLSNLTSVVEHKEQLTTDTHRAGNKDSHSHSDLCENKKNQGESRAVEG